MRINSPDRNVAAGCATAVQIAGDVRPLAAAPNEQLRIAAAFLGLALLTPGLRAARRARLSSPARRDRELARDSHSRHGAPCPRATCGNFYGCLGNRLKQHIHLPDDRPAALLF